MAGFKKYTLKKRELRNERNRTGNFPVTADPLDNLEKHITSIIGLEYIQGTNCPDSFPEEEVCVKILLHILLKLIWL